MPSRKKAKGQDCADQSSDRRDRRNRRQRPLLHDRPDQHPRDSRQNAVRRSLRRLHPRYTGREARRLSRPPRPRPPHPSHRAEFPRQHLRHEAPRRPAHHLRQRRRFSPGKFAPRRISDPRPILRQHQGPQIHVLRQWHCRARNLRQAHLPATLRCSRRRLPLR